MSKITFRADDDLVERLEAFDASKSEVMREALRAYLDGAERISGTADPEPEADETRASDASDAVGDALVDTVDALIADRLDRAMRERGREYDARGSARDINLNVTVEGARTPDAERSDDARSGARTSDSERKTRASAAEEPAESRCDQCGDITSEDHVYCPNCGEKSSHRVFCDCGDELRSDWAFCPGCGRRTPAADVLDRP